MDNAKLLKKGKLKLFFFMKIVIILMFLINLDNYPKQHLNS